MVRLAHLSDVHITATALGWARADWFSKRVTGWVHLRLMGRGHRFRLADEVLTALVKELHEHRPDRVVFSGDATGLGFEAEFARAAEILGVRGPEPLPGLAVPGNHDYYTRSVARSGLFEHYFAAWQTGERVGTDVYPFAQKAGPVWLVGVNSCTANFWSWDAGGHVDAAQLDRLDRLLPRLDAGPRILVTHYPVVLANGQPESRSHGLRNVRDLVAVAARHGVCLWLHGHRHGAYFSRSPSLAPFPAVCAGSATQHDHWSYNLYIVEGHHLHATRRMYDATTGGFRDTQTFELRLPEPGDKMTG